MRFVINVCGEIPFARELNPLEIEQLKKYIEFDLGCGMRGYGNSIHENSIELFDTRDILDDVARWLKKHDNNVVDGTVVRYYGDYDGSFRFENGSWEDYKMSTRCELDDEELIDELKYRGYDTSGLGRIS